MDHDRCQILSSRLKANTILCTPELIRAITPRLGRFLGPMGLMPAERRGTVTDDIAGYIKRIKSSSEWKADRAGNIRMPVARVCRHYILAALPIDNFSRFTAEFSYRGRRDKLSLCHGIDKKGDWKCQATRPTRGE